MSRLKVICFESFQRTFLILTSSSAWRSEKSYMSSTGAFPIELKRLNIYHAKHNSHFRMRALGLLESLLGLPPHELEKIALFRSNRVFIGSNAAAHRNGIDIPFSFIRYANEDDVESVPVCPQCLKDEPYIRQVWHLKPYAACTKHECELIHYCPECKAPLNYIENELIGYCSVIEAWSFTCIYALHNIQASCLSDAEIASVGSGTSV